MKTIKKNDIYKNYLSTHFINVRGGVNKLSQKYEFNWRYFKKSYLPFMPKDKNCRILDLSCGMGDFLYFLEKEGYKNYLGIDISDEAIKYLKNKKFNIKKANFFSFLKKNKKKFDLIVFNDTIEHLKMDEVLNALLLIRKNLSEKGILIVKTQNMGNIITGSFIKHADSTHEIGFTEHSLEQILNICDFKKIKMVEPDLYVTNNFVINYLGKFSSSILSILMAMLLKIYGEPTTKILTKDLVCIANK